MRDGASLEHVATETDVAPRIAIGGKQKRSAEKEGERVRGDDEQPTERGQQPPENLV